MIGKQDILERAREWQLRPEVVEKDYVLGWVLAAIAHQEQASSAWVLKGGTCVSFSLKFVLPALVPELSYNDLVIVDGRVASVEIARLLFVADRMPAAQRIACARICWTIVSGIRGPRCVCWRSYVSWDPCGGLRRVLLAIETAVDA